MVRRRVGAWKGKRGYDTCDVAEADLPWYPHRSVPVALQIHREPAYSDWHGSHDAHEVEKHSSVFGVAIVVDDKDHDVPGHGDAEPKYDEGKTLPGHVRDVGQAHGKAKGSCPLEKFRVSTMSKVAEN